MYWNTDTHWQDFLNTLYKLILKAHQPIENGNGDIRRRILKEVIKSVMYVPPSMYSMH
jgi:hypothetical protein